MSYLLAKWEKQEGSAYLRFVWGNLARNYWNKPQWDIWYCLIQNDLFIFHQSHLTIPHDNLPSCTHSEKHCKFLLINLFKPECIDISCLFFRHCSAELCYVLWSLETNFLSIWGGASGFYIPHLDLWFMPVPFTKVMDFDSHWYPWSLVVDT